MPANCCAAAPGSPPIAAFTSARFSSKRRIRSSVRHLRKPSGHSRCDIMLVGPATGTAAFAPIRPAEGTMPELRRIAVFGGIYSNYLALEAAITDAKRHE